MQKKTSVKTFFSPRWIVSARIWKKGTTSNSPLRILKSHSDLIYYANNAESNTKMHTHNYDYKPNELYLLGACEKPKDKAANSRNRYTKF